jgi:hypothetical protein
VSISIMCLFVLELLMKLAVFGLVYYTSSLFHMLDAGEPGGGGEGSRGWGWGWGVGVGGWGGGAQEGYFPVSLPGGWVWVRRGQLCSLLADPSCHCFLLSWPQVLTLAMCLLSFHGSTSSASWPTLQSQPCQGCYGKVALSAGQEAASACACQACSCRAPCQLGLFLNLVGS